MSERAARDPWAGCEAAPRPFDVLGMGEISLDRELVVDRWPEPGGKQALREERVAPGGQIATAALGCARLGLRTAFAAAVGDDPEAPLALAPLVSAGVATDWVVRVAGGRTRRAVVLVEAHGGERAVIADRDPRVRIEAPAAARAVASGPAGGPAARLLLVDASDPAAALAAARRAQALGMPVMCDVDTPFAGWKTLLAHVDFAVVSQRFAEGIGRASSVSDGLAELVRRGVRLAVATQGERGALARLADREIHSPAFAIEARDTTGAGDAFHAGLIAAALEGRPLEEALRMAHAVAALNCLAQGAQGGLPTRSELERFLQEARPRRDAGAPA